MEQEIRTIDARGTDNRRLWASGDPGPHKTVKVRDVRPQDRVRGQLSVCQTELIVFDRSPGQEIDHDTSVW